MHRQWVVPVCLRVASAGGAEIIILSAGGAESMMLSAGGTESMMLSDMCLRSILPWAKNNDNITMMDNKCNIVVKSWVVQ